MKRSILLGLTISTLVASMIAPAIAQTSQLEQQQRNLSKINKHEADLQNPSKLNPRFKEARQQNLNKLNPRLKEARRRHLDNT